MIASNPIHPHTVMTMMEYSAPFELVKKPNGPSPILPSSQFAGPGGVAPGHDPPPAPAAGATPHPTVARPPGPAKAHPGAGPDWTIRRVSPPALALPPGA